MLRHLFLCFIVNKLLTKADL